MDVYKDVGPCFDGFAVRTKSSGLTQVGQKASPEGEMGMVGWPEDFC